MEYFIGAAACLAVVLVINKANAWLKRRAEQRQAAQSAAQTPAPAAPTSAAAEIHAIARRLSDFYRASSHPESLAEGSEEFKRAVGMLCGPEFTPDELMSYAAGDNAVVSCFALEALRRRDDSGAVLGQVLDCVGTIAPWPQYFALRFLAENAGPQDSLIGPVLFRTAGYLDYRLSRGFIAQFVKQRLEAGEAPDFAIETDVVPDVEARKNLRRFLVGLEPELGGPPLEALDRWTSTRIDEEVLQAAGRLWSDRDSAAARAIIEHPALSDAISHLETSLTAPRPQSLLLVGERGVGKTVLLHTLAKRLYSQGWRIFIAGHNDLVAGRKYIGEFEQQLKAVLAQLGEGRRVIWFIPDFHAMAFAGRHRYSPMSALDILLPLVEQGQIRVVGETDLRAFERLMLQQPRAVTALTPLRLDPLPKEETLALARRWQERLTADHDEAFLAQAWDLCQQYLSDRAAPGNLLGLLETTRTRLESTTPAGRPHVGLDDVITTLATQSGLPMEVLDQRRGLDLDALRARLSQRVVGQPEAVDCLVERIAMLKAGVNDASRPVGVFLFAGPTGTGKTELAKTLAEWLFGDPQRLIRVDMSELQTAESTDRLLGQPGDAGGDSLAEQIRRQPFSVVLLDEFEKAHPNIWDLFLQVFDDARVTDRRGQTIDFRHTIIILTSNLGATIPTGVAIGFGNKSGGFDSGEVHRSVERAFRKEFINRLDRVVVFQPLTRALMRQILQKELVDAFQRRGLKNRTWAVEWDESAIDFLLDRGFTPDLGARPLRRAIERHLLSPLALTIVRRQAPDSDQFLFISAKDDRLEIRFVDPAAEEAAPAPSSDAAEPANGKLTPQSVLAHPQGSAEELAALRRHYEVLCATVENSRWHELKQMALEEMNASDFWSSPGRFATLSLAEYIDRITAGLDRAGSLLRRLEQGARGTKGSIPTDLLSLLAQNLHLLQAACADVSEGSPADAFLLVEARQDGTQDIAMARDFAARIAGMYESWAEQRRMRLLRLDGSPSSMAIDGAGGNGTFRRVYAVSGYGAHRFLAPESGLHVRERPSSRPRQFERDTVHVQVAAQPEGPSPGDEQQLARAAERALGEGGDNLSIVRRYREGSAPLVRDSTNDRRSGRLDFVLQGNFDLL